MKKIVQSHSLSHTGDNTRRPCTQCSGGKIVQSQCPGQRHNVGPSLLLSHMFSRCVCVGCVRRMCLCGEMCVRGVCGMCVWGDV